MDNWPSQWPMIGPLLGMQEYQAVIVKLTRHTRDNEDTLTDLLNERSRTGWEPAHLSQDAEQLIIIFRRSAVADTDTDA